MELEHDMSFKKSNFIPVFIMLIFFLSIVIVYVFLWFHFFFKSWFLFLKETIYDPFDSVYMYIVYYDLLR